jgi:para-nitrobenzyl esterase
MKRWTVSAAILLLVCAAQCFAQGFAPRVKVDSGVLEGRMQGDVATFLGIPYAAPPVGALRWKPPAPAASWGGVREAKEFGARCMQGAIYDDMVFRDPGISEDCLTLNVWTPAIGTAAKLPVMVWIHGGGFQAGASSEPRQDGQFLAQRGVVVVSMNYRLGIFGFLALPQLAAESGRNAAGNYGLLDQVAALQWVHRNIAALGGDPENVTIFGESAGSTSVNSLMASPLTHGLFRKAIGESGDAFRSKQRRSEPLADREHRDARFAKAALGSSKPADLRALPAKKVLEASLVEGSPRFNPHVDGYFLPQSVERIFAAGKQNDVSLLAGWNRDEDVEKTAPGGSAALERVKTLAQKEFGAKSEKFLEVYSADNEEDATRALDEFAADRSIGFSMWKWLEAQRSTGHQQVYRYRFDRSQTQAADKQSLGAYHSAEIEYVFGALDSKPNRLFQTEDRDLSNAIQKYWINFARTGDPNGAGLAPWPAYRASDGWQVMHLDAQCQAQPDDARARYLFLNAVWGD